MTIRSLLSRLGSSPAPHVIIGAVVMSVPSFLTVQPPTVVKSYGAVDIPVLPALFSLLRAGALEFHALAAAKRRTRQETRAALSASRCRARGWRRRHAPALRSDPRRRRTAYTNGARCRR